MPKTEEESWTFCLVSNHKFASESKHTFYNVLYWLFSGVYSSLLGEYARPSLDLSCRACTRMVTRFYHQILWTNLYYAPVPIELLTFC